MTARVKFELYYKVRYQDFHVEIGDTARSFNQWQPALNSNFIIKSDIKIFMSKSGIYSQLEPIQGYAVTTETGQNPTTLAADARRLML